MGSLMRDHYPDFNINDVETDRAAVRMGYFAAFYQNLDCAAFSPARTRSPTRARRASAEVRYELCDLPSGGGSATLDLNGRQRHLLRDRSWTSTVA